MCSVHDRTLYKLCFGLVSHGEDVIGDLFPEIDIRSDCKGFFPFCSR